MSSCIDSRNALVLLCGPAGIGGNLSRTAGRERQVCVSVCMCVGVCVSGSGLEYMNSYV